MFRPREALQLQGHGDRYLGRPLRGGQGGREFMMLLWVKSVAIKVYVYDQNHHVLQHISQRVFCTPEAMPRAGPALHPSPHTVLVSLPFPSSRVLSWSCCRSWQPQTSLLAM